jgi:hypothetical protein
MGETGKVAKSKKCFAAFAKNKTGDLLLYRFPVLIGEPLRGLEPPTC